VHRLRHRDILERAVRSIAEQAAKTNDLIDEAMEADLAADHPVTVAAGRFRVRRGTNAGPRAT
jgi:hypothetical protein